MPLRIRDQQRRVMAEAVQSAAQTAAAPIQPAKILDLSMARLRADGTVRDEEPTGGDAA